MTLKPTINDLQALGHLQTTYDWGIQFVSLPSLITGFTASDLNVRCTSATLPSREIDAIPIMLRGHRIFQHGIVNYKNQLRLTMYETTDSKLQDFLEAYMDMQWAPITGIQIPKATNQCSFLLTLLDSEQNQTKYYTIIGAWLLNYEPGDLQSTNSDVLTYSTTWQYDYYI